jgi:hypothetical protein
VGHRVAEVDRGGVAAVLVEDGGQAAVDLLERLVPGGRLELAGGAVADERGAQTIGVLVQRLEPVRLGAEEAAAEDVLLVSADLEDGAVARLDRDAAGGFAERAGAEVRGD